MNAVRPRLTAAARSATTRRILRCLASCAVTIVLAQREQRDCCASEACH